MSSQSALRPHQKTLVIACVLTMAGFLVPVLRDLLLPVMYLNTHLHELCHALVTMITGGEVTKIVVHADGSGETPVLGGQMFLIASAGYVGASICGALMIAFGNVEKTAKRALIVLTVMLSFSMVVWVRGDTVGEIAGLAWMVVLVGILCFVKGTPLMFTCQFLGLQQCLNSLLSVFALVKLSVSTDVESDASILEKITGLPAIMWAVIWSIFSIALVVWTLRKSWIPIPIEA